VTRVGLFVVQQSKVVELLRTSDSAFLYNAARLPKERCFLEGSQASPVSPSGKRNM
jgi:hypothetical protein